jgi:hypothetical protein
MKTYCLIRIFISIDILDFLRSWQPVKVAWTKSIIALGKLSEDTLIDAVPLDEVSEIHVMHEGSSNIPVSNHVEKVSSTADMSNLENPQNNSKPTNSQHSFQWKPSVSLKRLDSAIKSLSAPQSNDAHDPPIAKGLAAAGPVILIMTDDKGYNSGRKYYFQTKSDVDRREIVDNLAARSKAARTSKEAKGKLQKIRERVSDIIKSDPFQYFFAFLIAMVTKRHQKLHLYRVTTIC